MEKEYGTEIFLSRELSWLDFNSRVLDESACKALPLLERLKFIAIFSSNLDEFFMVRIAGLLRLIHAGISLRDRAGNSPARQLHLAKKKISALLKKQYELLEKKILPGLAENGIFIKKTADISAAGKNELQKFFQKKILPALTPLAVDPEMPFPRINSGAIEIAVSVNFPNRKKNITAFLKWIVN